MKIVREGFSKLSRPVKFFALWVQAMLLVGVVVTLLYSAWSLFGALILGFVAWNLILVTVSYTNELQEKIQAKALSQTNGHQKRSLIVIFNEKKENDTPS